jgi:hypothetical protein
MVELNGAVSSSKVRNLVSFELKGVKLSQFSNYICDLNYKKNKYDKNIIAR